MKRDAKDSSTAQSKRPLAGFEIAILLAIVLVGAGLRLGYLWEIKDAPEFVVPPIDAGFHDYWARGLAMGDWSLPPMAQGIDPRVSSSPYLRPPGYPFFLAGMYALWGPGYLAPRIVQLLLGLLSVVLVFSLGRAMFGRAVGLISAGLLSTYWIHIYFEAQLHAPVLLTLLLLIFFSVIWRQRPRFTGTGGLCTGLVLGLYAVCRPNILLFVPAVLVWTWWVASRRGEGKRAWIFGLSFAVGVAALVSLPVLRNWAVADYPTISANAGINLYLGNNERATGTFVPQLPAIGRFSNLFEYPVVLNRLEHQLGRRLDHRGAGAYWTGRALEYAKQHPLDWIVLTLKKAYLFWSPHEISNYTALHHNRAASPTLSRIPLDFSLILALGLFGFGLLVVQQRRLPPDPSRRWPHQVSLLIALFVGCYFLSYLPFFATGLYRVPLIWSLMLMAAYGIVQIFDRVRTKAFKRLAFSLPWLIALIALTRIPWVPYQPSPARMYLDRGVAYEYAGNDLAALALYQQAITAEPGHLEALFNAANSLARLERTDEAIATYRRALSVNPRYAPAQNNLGVLWMNRRDLDQAMAHFTNALTVEPFNVQALTNMGLCLARKGHLAEAITHFNRALVQPGADQEALLTDLANAQRLLRQRSAASATHNRLGLLFMGTNRHRKARAQFKKALALDPTNGDARENLLRLSSRSP